MLSKKNAIKTRKLLRWLVGTIAVFSILLVACFIKLNNKEKIQHPTVDKTEKLQVTEPIDTKPEPTSVPEILINEETKDLGDNYEAYHGDITPVSQYDRDELPRIVCWGDSLTETADAKTAYPDVLRELSGTNVVNFGLHSDSTRQIAMREGAISLHVSECIIPADNTPIEINVSPSSGKLNGLFSHGFTGINPCMIGNISGNIDYNGSVCTFTRSEIGEITPVTAGTSFRTYGSMNKRSDDVIILFSGANDGLTIDEVSYLIENQKLILDDLNSSDYLVIGPTYADNISDLPKINEALSKEYKEHFLNAYDYLVNYALDDANIEATAKDKSDILLGNVPDSLRIDVVHGTQEYYRLLAKQVYRKLMYLGYLPLDEDFLNNNADLIDEEAGDSSEIAKRVVCWGDSFTEGTGGKGVTFPKVIDSLAHEDGKDVTVLNYGVFGEESSLIAARSGGNPMRLRDGVTIPADCTPVEVVPISDMQGYEMLLVFGGDTELSAAGADYKGDNSINPCIMGGVEGNLSMDGSTGIRYFTRLESGEEAYVGPSDIIEFWAMRDKKTDDILVIWSGTNDEPTPDTIASTINYINSIIDYTGTDKYVVINMTKIETIPQIEEVNKKMADEYGEHLIDLRGYMLNDALSDAGITPTKEDKEYLEDGRVPRSLYDDDIVHYTAKGYELIGKLIYDKLCELKYL